MPRLPSWADTDRNYRRDAIMGLTVAEAFMAIAFALPMLLALWRYETDTDSQVTERDLHSALAENKALERELARMENLRGISRLSPEVRAMLLEMAEEGRLRLTRVLEENRLGHREGADVSRDVGPHHGRSRGGPRPGSPRRPRPGASAWRDGEGRRVEKRLHLSDTAVMQAV
ncbi:hypothetical protein [Pararhodobacter sp. SW119]|uniref:hypothetical protein n=1 Tax=Pararhodobacter sp. SW119 TaxID=2780075 RepID=UPI001ADFB5F6|nr:hypothetical protein [Pararhodobacter sp. SW119]